MKTTYTQELDKPKYVGILYQLTHSTVAANVLLLLMFLAGFWGLSKLNTQFFPSFDLERVSIRTVWAGASSEDVERLLTTQIEEAILAIDNVDRVTSSSARGVSAITVTFVENTDMAKALEDVKQQVDQLTNLPADAEKPTVSQIARYETIAEVSISSDNMDVTELRHIAREIEQELLVKGVNKIDMKGYPQLEVVIELSQQVLRSYGLTIAQVRQQIAQASVDAPIGSAAESVAGVELRVIQQRRRAIDFASIPIRLADQQVVNLGAISNISYEPVENSVFLFQGDEATITLEAKRLESNSTLAAAEILKNWQRFEAPKYVERVNIALHNRNWILLEQRIGILLQNGLSGLVLVLVVLLLFVNVRTAFWVAVGIPSSLMLTMGIFYMLGGSINMISLFAFILTLGIIVDDAIVVGEHAMYRLEQGHTPLDAALMGARRMFFPVLASSLTTIAAFLPLVALSGTIGKFLVTIPIVAICVIAASLVECFTVLPGHLHHSFANMQRRQKQPSRFRLAFDRGFKQIQDVYFRRLVQWSLRNRLLVVVLAFSCLFVSFQLVKTGRVGFIFFPVIEANTINLDANFVAGTPQSAVKDYLRKADKALQDTDQSFGGGLIKFSRQGLSQASRGTQGANFGSITVELIDGDKRSVRNREFIRSWKRRLPKTAGLEKVGIAARRGGPRGQDLAFQLFSRDIKQLKEAAVALTQELKNIPGASNFGDDLSFGKDQLVMQLKPLAKSLDISADEIARQVRNAFTGVVAQTYTDGKDDIDVRVRLSAVERNNLGVLDELQIRLNNNQYAPLANLVQWQSRRGFDVIRHYNGRASVNVFADLDDDVATASEVLPNLTQQVLPKIASQYNVGWQLEGSSKRQAKTFADMRTGMLVGLSLIYVILVWVFASWGWPLLILTIIPFGLFGAIMGHLFLGHKLTILSMLGMFGLSGIVINDSIILVTTYRELLQKGIAFKQAIVDAACLRLRAVVLTSLTTILGLTPLLFETSLQAQFLIPMAITITFGLLFATGIILIFLPVLLSLYEQLRNRLSRSMVDTISPTSNQSIISNT